MGDEPGNNKRGIGQAFQGIAMPQLFHRRWSTLSRLLFFGGPMWLAAVLWISAQTVNSPRVSRVGVPVEQPDSATRREFLTLMVASMALAGMHGCGPPREEIVPYVKASGGIKPGEPLFIATAMTLGGIATGLLVEQRMGRPIKIEGNPDHPASLGATNAFAQAAVLSLYDPDRSRSVIHEDNQRLSPRSVVPYRPAAPSPARISI